MVDGSNMQFYYGGVFTNCGTTLNYNILLVANINDYWELKSSWGPSWEREAISEFPKVIAVVSVCSELIQLVDGDYI